MRPMAPRSTLSIEIGLFQRRPERAPVSTAMESARRPACAVEWSSFSRSPRTSSPCRCSISRRSASMLVESAWTRPAAFAQAAIAAARIRSPRPTSSARLRTMRWWAGAVGSGTRLSAVSADEPARSCATTAGSVSSASRSASARTASTRSRCARACRSPYTAADTDPLTTTAAAKPPQARAVRTVSGAARTAHRHRPPVITSVATRASSAAPSGEDSARRREGIWGDIGQVLGAMAAVRGRGRAGARKRS